MQWSRRGCLQYTDVAHSKGVLAAAGTARSPTHRREVTAQVFQAKLMTEMTTSWSDWTEITP